MTPDTSHHDLRSGFCVRLSRRSRLSLRPQPRIPPRLLDLATLVAAQLVDDVLRKLLRVDHGQVGRLNWAV